MSNKKFKEPSMMIAEGEDMPDLTVPSKGNPTAKAPPQQNESATQYNRKIETFRYACSPDGYPTVINNPEGITESILEDPYVKKKIRERSGVLGIESAWFTFAEKNAAWRVKRGLPDSSYTGAYVNFESDEPEAYYNAQAVKRDPRLEKRGPYQQFINGISYVPKALILREQPALKLFSMQGDDPRQPSMEDLENDRKDPYYLTVANSLTETRSFPVRTQIGNNLTDSRNAVNKLNQMRFIKVAYPYGEGIGAKPWALKCNPNKASEKITMPHDLNVHRKNVMTNGINPHAVSSNFGGGLGTSATVQPN